MFQDVSRACGKSIHDVSRQPYNLMGRFKTFQVDCKHTSYYVKDVSRRFKTYQETHRRMFRDVSRPLCSYQ